MLSLSLLPVLLASADDTPCGAAQWAAYWRAHLNATTVPPRACAYVPGYSCCSDENWWPKVICRSHRVFHAYRLPPPPPHTHTHTHTHTNARTHLYTHKPDNSTPVNALSDPWSQARCGAACDAQGAACTAFVYGYEAYEVGGKDAGVAPGCSDAQPACLFSNPDPLCHVPRCYLRNVRNLSCGAESCGTGATGFPGGGSVGCSQKDASGALLPWGEFSLYKKGEH